MAAPVCRALVSIEREENMSDTVDDEQARLQAQWRSDVAASGDQRGCNHELLIFIRNTNESLQRLEDMVARVLRATNKRSRKPARRASGVR